MPTLMLTLRVKREARNEGSRPTLCWTGMENMQLSEEHRSKAQEQDEIRDRISTLRFEGILVDNSISKLKLQLDILNNRKTDIQTEIKNAHSLFE